MKIIAPETTRERLLMTAIYFIIMLDRLGLKSTIPIERVESDRFVDRFLWKVEHADDN